MKCILVEKIGACAVVEKECPRPGTGEVLLKVNVAGVCRTDLKIVRAGHRDLVLPRIPGEEVVGSVVEVGAGVSGIAVGRRMYVYPGIWCGTCGPCRQGAQNLCRDMRIMGFHRDGGFAEYVVAPAQSLIDVPDTLSDEEAVFAEPLSCCLNALELSGIKPGMTVAIWGAGPAGTLLARASRALGFAADVVDPDEKRCERAGGHRLPPSKEYDACICAVGSAGAYRQAIARLAPRGRLVVFSGLSPADETIPVSFNQLHYREQSIVGAYGCSYRHGEDALNMIAAGSVKVRDMITHRFVLDDIEQALAVVELREGIKVHLYPDRKGIDA
ncbi:MAG TPA: alcohol dehydrogenase catalytic domain-containing protein [bacterium]|nr:alcohol dehydrogenase catalytic domain-containing protein [bacterium]